MIHDKTIVVGACDWQHENWLGNFYPDDLPEDWRLSFYANEFSAVLVPEAKWRAEGADIEDWADEVPEAFQFYFLTATVQKNDAFVKGALGDAFGGFVGEQGNEDVALIDVESKGLREWKDWLVETKYNVIFLKDINLTSKSLSEFKSLLELMGY